MALKPFFFESLVDFVVVEAAIPMEIPFLLYSKQTYVYGVATLWFSYEPLTTSYIFLCFFSDKWEAFVLGKTLRTSIICSPMKELYFSNYVL